MTIRKRSSLTNDETEYKDEERRKKSKQHEAGLNNKQQHLYKGMNNYTDYRAGFRRAKAAVVGPQRCSPHIRATTTYDYQPYVCKDYKETGYCGYGDSCKFLHDRADYKSGYQIDKEHELEESNRARKIVSGLDKLDDDDDDDHDNSVGLALACQICKRTFVNPVVTKCKHRFCERCALKHHSKTKRCFVCNQPTQGIFNVARDILKNSR